MIRPGTVWAIASAEARLTRRLARFWIFGILTVLVCLLMFGQWAFIHTVWSAINATAGSMNPRFLLSFLAFWAVVLFALGVVFLGYEVRARDVRERIYEAVDSRPFTNLELVAGRYLGILMPMWFMAVTVVLSIWAVSAMIGSTVSATSVLQFLVFECLPAFTLLIGLTFLCSVVIRHRGAAAVLLILAVAGVFTGNMFSPVWLSPISDMTGAFNIPFPSDLMFNPIDMPSFFQRFGILLVGFGLLGLAAAAYPRLDVAKRRNLAIAASLLIAGFAIEGWIVADRVGMIRDVERWKEVHAARTDEAAPDVTAMTASLDIRPGSRIDMELEMQLRAPADATLRSALFTLNPGIEVSSVKDAASGELTVTQQDGLVEVALSSPLGPGEDTTLFWTASGRPDPVFAYIDTAKDLMRVTALDGNLFMLGFDSMIFRGDHVSLPGAARWLPAAGAEIGRGDPSVRPEDFYTLDLSVKLPDGWLAAGPGKRVEEGDGFRFNTLAPIGPPTLIADEYVSRSVEIGEVTAEVLISPAHADVLEVFEDAADAIAERIELRLNEAHEVGLGYPYDGITLVEVPNQLRGFGGGWKMGTIQGPPAVVLMRESSFPTARFDRRFKDPKRFEDVEGGVAAAKRDTLEQFFTGDLIGGNVFANLSKSFFSHQLQGIGPEGLPLDYVHEDLASRIATGHSGYFSAYVFDRNMNAKLTQAINKFVAENQAGRSSGSLGDTFVDVMTGTAEVWESALDTTLVEIDPWENPGRTLNLLALKGSAMARSLLDTLGRDKAGRFLAALRERNSGGSYTRDDVLAAAESIGEDLSPWLTTWLDETDLPGYLVGEPKAYRAEDAEDGSPRYAVSFIVRNDEPVPGMIQARYGFRSGWGAPTQTTDPIRIEGNTALEIGLVFGEPPAWITVDPYLSLNRTEFDVRLPTIDKETIVPGEPLDGTRVVEWVPEGDAVVIDDLSEGFYVEADEGKSMRLGVKASGELDQGLPVRVQNVNPKEWSREDKTQAFGKYRHTTALIRGGKGDKRAVFGGVLPETGNWGLEIHLPQPTGGTWKLEVREKEAKSPLAEFEFAARDLPVGWHPVESVDLNAGEVEVVLSNESEGLLVYADAVRWVPGG